MDHGRHTYLTFRNILIYVVLLWSGMTVNAQGLCQNVGTTFFYNL